MMQAGMVARRMGMESKRRDEPELVKVVIREGSRTLVLLEGTTKLWGSRPDVVKFGGRGRRGGGAYQGSGPGQVGPEDYVIAERIRMIGRNGHVDSRYHEVAGKPPAWATFPRDWKLWVTNPIVRRSALDFLRSRALEGVNDIMLAEMSKTRDSARA